VWKTLYLVLQESFCVIATCTMNCTVILQPHKATNETLCHVKKPTFMDISDRLLLFSCKSCFQVFGHNILVEECMNYTVKYDAIYPDDI
jgi:hypothetical protein